VKGIAMRDVEVGYMKEDARPPFMLTDVVDANFFNLRGQRGQDVPTFVLKKVENFSLQQSWPLSDTRIDRADSKKL
jgi:hypothetical protein